MRVFPHPPDLPSPPHLPHLPYLPYLPHLPHLPIREQRDRLQQTPHAARFIQVGLIFPERAFFP